MSERYPDDATLLALAEDPINGVEYIATGKRPYYLDFRKLVHRLSLSAHRANDLRVYRDGDLTVGVRPGRCVLKSTSVELAPPGAAGISITPSATTHIWLDVAGIVQTGVSGLPGDRTSFVPLAAVTADATTITELDDLRGEAFLQVPDLAFLGVTASASAINETVEAIQVQFRHEGDLSSSLSAKIVGATPIDGVVTDVVMSVGANLISGDANDEIIATAKVNSVSLTSTHPAISAAAGSGFRSTAQGDGVPAVIKTDGTQNVSRGDLLTVDLTRNVTHATYNDAADLVVMVVIRPQ